MRSLPVVLAVAVLSGCAALSSRVRPERAERPRCEFVVYNRTSYALDVRLMRDTTGRSVAMSIGTLNPNEALTERASCSQGAVWVRGYTLPVTVAMPATFPFVDGWTDLSTNERRSISLHWPP